MSATAARDRLLAWLRGELGTVEGPNPNQVRYNNLYYGRLAYGPTYAWCQVFLYCGGLATGVASVLPPKTAWTVAAAAWYQQRGRWHTTPAVGDQVFYDWGQGIAHTGVVESVRSDGTFVAIEGNTDAAGGGSGGRVMRQVRRLSKLGRRGGFGRPNYAAAGIHEEPSPLVAGAVRRPDVLPVLARASAERGWTSLAQQALRITADGSFGPATTAAVMDQQRAYGLAIDGEIGPWTWISFVADAGANLAEGDAKDHPGVEVLQNLLGYRGSDLDRSFGPGTSERVREVQRWAQLRPDAVVGAQTRAALTRG